jgi:GT2 family glycosyltransferase
MPIISFIIPLYNHLSYTQAMLDSLLCSLSDTLDYEVLLVDDASTDDTPIWLQGLEHPRVRFLINPQNQGYARTNNRGVIAARSEYLGLLNNDLLFISGWFEPLFKILTDPMLNAGLVGNVQYRVGDQSIDHAGVQLNLRGQFEHIHTIEAHREYRKVAWVTGACMLIRRDLFQDLGGFDTRYRNGCEDIDLCFKIRQARKHVFVSYLSQIQHHVSLSRGSVSLQNERNSQLLFKQWRSEIKHALANLWTQTLQTDITRVIDECLESYISPKLLATPHLAGRLIAESMLLKQESHWIKILPVWDTEYLHYDR